MNVENMTNYGKGIVESLSSPEYKYIEKQMFIPVISSIRKEVGLIGLLKLFFQWRSEEKKIKRHNWFKLENKGVSREVFESTFQLIALMKVLDNMIGIERARRMITEIYEKTETRLKKNKSPFNLFSLPIRDLKSCKNSFLSFKEYTKAQFKAGIQEKFHESETLEDTENTLAVDVKYCVAHEVAKEFGNSAWSFPWCEIDEVVYPRMGAQLGFKFSRSGSLPTGASKCDFRFERLGS